jgi:hypothetical protein
MAIKVNGTTVIDDGRNLVNIVSGAGSSTTAGDVGTYGYLANDGTGGIDDRNFGGTITGSKLMWRNNYFVSGTWRAMGDGAARQGYNLWVRIS